MHATKRILALCATVAMVLGIVAVPALAAPEGTLISRINGARAGAGLAPLEQYWDLTDDARAHTDAMIGAGHIYHNPGLAGVTGVWEKLGENVGVGIDADSLHDAFMASSGHRANILGDFNYVGVGVKSDADGLMWVTVIFMKAPPGLNGGETTTTAPPTTTVPPAEPPSAAVPESTTPTTYEVKQAAPAPKASTAVKTTAPEPEREPVVGYGLRRNLPI